MFKNLIFHRALKKSDNARVKSVRKYLTINDTNFVYILEYTDKYKIYLLVSSNYSNDLIENIFLNSKKYEYKRFIDIYIDSKYIYSSLDLQTIIDLLSYQCDNKLNIIVNTGIKNLYEYFRKIVSE